jgi:hypothetical protein
MMRAFVVGSTLALAMLPGLASASTVATLDAGYDGQQQNTYFTITNDSGSAENVTLQSFFTVPYQQGRNSISLGSLGAGQSVTYYFQEPDGGFQAGGWQVGMPDTATYQFSVTLNGQALSSNVFSPNTNLTGNYVDFFGNTCFGFSDGCAVATSGTVAAITAAVPEPSTWAMLIIGFVGVAMRLRGAVRQFA